jgi:hypothetical protein
MAELEISLEKVCWFIAHSREVQAKTAAAGPDSASNQSDDGFRETLEDRPGDFAGPQLESAFHDLDASERRDLLALFILGRGDAEDWASALESVREAAHAGLHRRLVEQPLLGDYLEEGLARIGRSCSE